MVNFIRLSTFGLSFLLALTAFGRTAPNDVIGEFITRQERSQIHFERSCSSRDAGLEADVVTHIIRGRRASSNLIEAYSGNQLKIEPRCVFNSMNNAFWKKPDRFATCVQTVDNRFSVRPATALPCLSQNYVTASQKILSGALNCFRDFLAGEMRPHPQNPWRDSDKVRMDGIMAMLKKESGLHMHAKSYSGALGTSQIVDACIQNVNRQSTFNISAMRSYLNHYKHKDPVCYSINEALAAEEPISPGIAGRCGRIEISSGNPLLNILYGIANVAENTRRIRHITGPTQPLKFLMEGLPNEAAKAQMETYLAIWSHNTGFSGLTTVLRGKSSELSQIRTVSGRIQAISQILKTHYTREARGNPDAIKRANEVSKYVPDMLREYSTMQAQSQRQAGDSNLKCLSFDNRPRSEIFRSIAPESFNR